MITFEDFLKSACDGNLEIVQQYIEENKNDVRAINRKTFNAAIPDDEYSKQQDDTALIYSARNGHFSIVKALLGVKGIDINASNDCGITALMYAASGHRFSQYDCYFRGGKKVKELLGKNPKQEELYQVYTNFSEFHEDFKTWVGVDQLYKAYVNQLNLIEAYTNIVDALLAVKGIDIDASNRQYKTALMYAASHNHTAIVQSLLNAGANPTLRNVRNPGETADTMTSNETIRALIKHPAIVRFTENNIEYIQDNLNTLDSDMLKKLFFNIANLVAVDKKYEHLSHELYKLASDLGHDTAQRIVMNFRDIEEGKIDLDNNSNESPSISDSNEQKPVELTEVEKTRSARLKFFGQSLQNSIHSRNAKLQPAEKRQEHRA